MLNAWNCIFLAPVILFTSTLMAQEIAGNFSLEKTQRLNTPEHNKINDHWVGLTVGGFKKRQKLGYNYKLDSRLYIQTSGYAYSVPEAYFTYDKWGNNFQIGRKLVDWAPEDRFWMLGTLQGMKGFQLLDTQQEGLLGLHLNRRFKRARVQLVASPFYVPTLNPSKKVKDGELISQTDWDKRYPKYTKYNGELIPLYYEQGPTNMGEILLQETLGMAVDYHSPIGTIRGFGIYKPEPDLRINATASYNQKTLGKERIDILASPIVNHHLVYGVDYAKKIETFDFEAGTLSINPNVRMLGDNLAGREGTSFDQVGFKIKPSYERIDYFHTGLGFRSYLFGIKANFLKNLNETTPAGDDLSSSSVKWQQAIGSEMNYQLTSKVAMDFSYRYDIKKGDQLLKGEMGWLIQKDKLFQLGVEMIDAPTEDSYWASYRTNDTVYSRFSLIF